MQPNCNSVRQIGIRLSERLIVLRQMPAAHTVELIGMEQNYSDKDTERVRMQQSSAGLPTQQLGELPPGSYEPQSSMQLPPQYAGAAAVRPSRNNMGAIALIGVGLFLLLGQMLQGQLEIEGGMVLFTIASCFLFFAFWKRIYGLLIPGSILAGLSVGVTFADLTNGVSVLWGLALGFLSILVVGRSLFGVRSNWPIFPAIPLFAIGVIVAVASLPGFLGLGMIWLPLGLIGAGLFLGWKR
jgi:hypothetical protein